MLRFLGTFFVIACMSFADTIPFSGSGSSGTVAPGQTWNLTYNSPDTVWSIPGYLAGEEAWAGSGEMDGFTITFTGLPSGSAIDNSITPECSGAGVVMCSNVDPWSSVVGTDTVTFTAPSGVVVDPGDDFFVNIPLSPPLTGGELEGVAFDGSFQTVPEPGSLALLSAGLVSLGLLGWRRRR